MHKNQEISVEQALKALSDLAADHRGKLKEHIILQASIGKMQVIISEHNRLKALELEKAAPKKRAKRASKKS